MENTSANTSCAIVVTFNPDVGALLKLLGQLNKETDFVVVDNGSGKIGQFKESIRVYPRCKMLFSLPENVGLAEALNIGLKDAIAREYKFAFLFDQDSRLCDLYVKRMLSAYSEVSGLSVPDVAALGPRIINPQTKRQTKFKLFSRLILRSDRLFCGSKQHYQTDFLITSGTLLALSNLAEIGLMKASYFIDNVDLEWCFRARSMGYELVGTDQAVLYHAIGERSANPLVRRGIMAQHNPTRTYYSSRNRVHLYHTPYSPWGWRVRDCVRFLVKISWLLLSSSERKQYWENVWSGIRDARSLN